jgi:hypothetical protein
MTQEDHINHTPVIDNSDNEWNVNGSNSSKFRVLFYSLALTILVSIGSIFYNGESSQPSLYQSNDFSHIQNEYPKIAGSGTVSSASGGNSCVKVLTENSYPVIQSEECGSTESVYRIVERVPRASNCFKDSDVTYSWKPGGVEETLCLDYDWTSKDCMIITLHNAAKGPCGGNSSAVRAETVVLGAVDISYCKFGGIPHPVRRFTVCVAQGAP